MAKNIPIGIPIIDATEVANDTDAVPAKKVANGDDAIIRELQAKGYPLGLAREMQKSALAHPLRFWIIDNSYSMQCEDGQRLVKGRGRGGVSLVVVTSTRTDELRDAVLEQVELSAALGARTDFHHLNAPPMSSSNAPPKFLTFAPGNTRGAARDPTGCARAGESVSSTEEAAALLSDAIEPCGTTPLTEAVENIRTQLAPVAAKMREKGQQAVVVIATDGLPDDKRSFLRAMQQLQAECPVWVVVRLCTSDDDIVDYWGELDKALERPLEVLDDVFGEAGEVGARNAWLAYGPPLHAARLCGMRHKLFDLLDERTLSLGAVKQFAELLLGCEPLPEPEAEPDAFLEELRAVVGREAPVYDPRLRRMRPWIDVDAVAARVRMRGLLLGLGLGALIPCVGA